MIDIFVSEPFANQIDSQQLEKAAASVLTHQNIPPEADLTIAIEDDARLQELNMQFLGIEAPTDVLSFPSEEVDPETGNIYLGDVIISYPRAEAQANSAGHPVASELQLLVVHGVLHLVGHDHADEVEKTHMWDAQKEILDALGASLNRYSEE